MPYTLCVLGCGTMGIAVLSGVIDNLDSPLFPTRVNDTGLATPMESTPLVAGAAEGGAGGQGEAGLVLAAKLDSVPDTYVLPPLPLSFFPPAILQKRSALAGEGEGTRINRRCTHLLQPFLLPGNLVS